MKAAFLAGPRSIELRDVPPPTCPPDGVVLETRACGVCGSDLRRWREGPPPGVPHLIQGHELAGLVVEVGPRVTRFQVGDRLAVAPDIHCGECWYCRRGLFNLCPALKLLGITPGLDGGFAERVVLSGELLRNGIVHRMPDGLGWHEGALAETLSSVLAALEKCRLESGEVMAVIGAGPIGCLHLVLGRARGARVILVQRSARRRALAGRFDPEAVIDAANEDVVTAVRRLTADRGADVVMVANGSPEAPPKAVEMARRGGRIVLFGGLPKADPMVRLNANLIHYGEQVVLGAFSYHPRFHEEALEVLRRKIVRAEQFVTHTRPLSQIAEAFAIADSGDALKVMVEPD